LNRMDFLVHGIAVKVETEDDAFADYVRGNLSLFPSKGSTRPDLEVEYRFQEDSTYQFRPDAGMERIGRDLWRQEGSVLYRMRGLEIRVSTSDSALRVDARYHLRKRKAPLLRRMIGRLWRSGLPETRKFEICHYSARYCLHLPLFWVLLSRGGLALVHASSVLKNGKALIFTGLNNCGKSTLAAYLSTERGWPQLSDNFTLVDGMRVYAYPERRRISPDMVSSLPMLSSEGKRVYGKLHLSESRQDVPIRAEAETVYFLSIGAKTFKRELTPEEALVRTNAINDYLGEFPEYSYLRFLKDGGYRESAQRALRALFRNTEQYLLVQSAIPDLAKTYKLIEETLPDA